MDRRSHRNSPCRIVHRRRGWGSCVFPAALGCSHHSITTVAAHVTHGLARPSSQLAAASASSRSLDRKLDPGARW
eukprot:15478893-Alexandrium_andersonii.AAC.1